jgi:agmatine deiminase
MREAAKSERVYLLAGAAHLEEARAQAGEVATILEIETDDAWARDIGPTFVMNGTEGRGIDWRFNAWGGSVDGLNEDYADDDAAAEAFCNAIGADCYDAEISCWRVAPSAPMVRVRCWLPKGACSARAGTRVSPKSRSSKR